MPGMGTPGRVLLGDFDADGGFAARIGGDPDDDPVFINQAQAVDDIGQAEMRAGVFPAEGDVYLIGSLRISMILSEIWQRPCGLV